MHEFDYSTKSNAILSDIKVKDLYHCHKAYRTSHVPLRQGVISPLFLFFFFFCIVDVIVKDSQKHTIKNNHLDAQVWL